MINNLSQPFAKSALRSWLLSALFCTLCITPTSCGDDDKGKGGAYDPSRKVELTDFYPDSGFYQQKVLLHGSNFGSDPKAIKVYFNAKQAPVIGAAGDIIYVNAPRLPGDECVISVVVGNDSVAYPQTFRYFKTTTVTTLCGNGLVDDPIEGGTLSSAVLCPRYVCVDKDDNVFVSCWSHTHDDPHLYNGSFGICRINELENLVDVVFKSNDIGQEFNAPCANPQTGVVTLPNERTPGSYLSLDPKEFWAPRYKDVIWPSDYSVPEKGWKHCLVVNPTDGCIYTRFYYGHVIKFDPSTGEVTPICKTSTGDSYGLTFNPKFPNRLFLAIWQDAGSFSHSICCIDVNDPQPKMVRLSNVNTSGGHRDGRLENAQFRNPSQIYCDSDGNIFVADCGNHCIRRITPEGMVETVLGIPGVSGWRDGGKDDALFNGPTGIGISNDGSVYVADWGNGRVRKMTIN